MARNAQIAFPASVSTNWFSRSPMGRILRIDAGKLTNDIRHEAIMHGLKQKIGDAAAIGRNPGDRALRNPADKRAAMRATR